MNVAITAINSVTKEGMSFTLNKPAKLGKGMAAKEWYVSWDKIGKALFGAEYTDAVTVTELKHIRGE